MLQKILPYIQLMRVDKPIGILLLLWPTLWAFWLSGNPDLKLIIIFSIGVFLMRSAGCVVNDLSDQRFDGFVERTKNRPLVNGSISRRQAYLTFFILIALSSSLLLFLPNVVTLFAIFAFLTTLLYPLMKRYTHLPQLILGIAFSWSIPMVFASTTGTYPISCWLLFGANILWTIAYDTMYAMVDREDDLKIGVKSSAILFGQFDKLIVGLLQLLTILIFMMIGYINDFHFIYFLLVGIALCLFIYQQVLIRNRERSPCFKAFLNNNYVGLALLIGFIFANSLG